MAIEKLMKTRIVLTHDEYTALAGKTLKNGEVVLVKVGTTVAVGKVSEPIWMMKVGDGTSTVAQCPWLVAPAADVYEWAKKASLDVEDIPALSIDKITGLTEALAGKADSEHTHDASEITVGEDTGLDTEEIKTVEDAISYLGEWIGTVEGVQLEQADAIATKADKEEFDAHNHKASDLTDFATDVQAVVNEMSLGGDIEGLDERLTDAEEEIEALNTAVTTTLPGQIATKVEQEVYNNKVAALEQADADEKAAREALDTRVAALEADDTTKTYVDTELEKKVDKETYSAKIEELVQADTDLDTAVKTAQKAAEDAQKDIDTFMGVIESDTTAVDTLNEIIALINSEDSELSSALMAEITALKEKFNADGKALEAVNADTVDGKHAADFATKEQGATADATAATIATYGDIVTHKVEEFATKEQGAKADTALQAADIVSKADKVTGATNGNFAGLDENGNLTDSGKKAADFEDAGAAAQALTDAKAYTDGEIDKIENAIGTKGDWIDTDGGYWEGGSGILGDIVTLQADVIAANERSEAAMGVASDASSAAADALHLIGTTPTDHEHLDSGSGIKKEIYLMHDDIANAQTSADVAAQIATDALEVANSKIDYVVAAEGSGLKATRTYVSPDEADNDETGTLVAGTTITIDFNDEVVFVLDGGTAADLT